MRTSNIGPGIWKFLAPHPQPALDENSQAPPGAAGQRLDK
jgi:hypothetical protein